jgi:hypothetical protein
VSTSAVAERPARSARKGLKGRAVGGPSVDRDEVCRAFSVLVDRDQRCEFRALHSRRSEVCRGADPDAAVKAAERLSGGGALYYTVNPVRPDLVGAASDPDIVRRRLLMIDVDANRPADVSATDAEKAQSLALAERVRKLLAEQGWPNPVVIDSGNGYHLLYRVDLPNDAATDDLVKRLLRHLAKLLDTPGAKIDKAVYNASRIAKLPGTWARKGANTAERPHRMCRLVSVPTPLEVVPAETIAQTAGAGEPVPPPAGSRKKQSALSRIRVVNTHPYVRRALEDECAEVVKTPEGNRNNRLNKAAFAIGQFVGGGHIARGSAEERLGQAGAEAGLPADETERTVRSGLTSGIQEPRDIPERKGKASCPPAVAPVAAGPQAPSRRMLALAPYRPFPVEWLPDPIGRFVLQSSRALGCDAAYLALTSLTAAGSLIGNKRVIALKPTWREPSVFWSAIIGDSGTLKSPAWQRALAFLFRLQRRLLKEYKVRRAAHEEALTRYEEAKRKAKKVGGNPGEPPEEPAEPRIVCSDTTIESLVELLADNPAGLLLARDELDGWLRSFTRYRQQGGTDLPNWLEMHRAGTIIVDRKTGDRRTYHIPRAAISITGGIQPGVLVRAATSEFFDSGLVARLLMAMPPRVPKQSTEAEVDPLVERDYQATLEGLHGLGFDTDQDGEKVPHVLRLSPLAKEAWIAFYNEWAQEQAAAEGELAAALSKLEAYAARFALLHHVVSRVALGASDLAPVEPESIAAGVRLCRWFAYEARRIYSTIAETTGGRDVRRLAEFIHDRGGKITARDLQRANSRKYPTSEQAQQALDALVQHGAAEWLEPGAAGRGGQPARVLRLLAAPDTTDTTDTCLPGGATGPEQVSVVSGCHQGNMVEFGGMDVADRSSVLEEESKLNHPTPDTTDTTSEEASF